jgi:integrase
VAIISNNAAKWINPNFSLLEVLVANSIWCSRLKNLWRILCESFSWSYSGLRRNELFGLRGSDIELQEGGLIVRYKRKGGKYQRREVAHADVRDALLAYLKKSKRLSVFHTNDPLWTRHDRAGEPGLPLTSRSYANNLKKYAAKAGMRRVNIHQTRHTYARIIFEDSGDLLETQSALDHESQVTTRA